MKVAIRRSTCRMTRQRQANSRDAMTSSNYCRLLQTTSDCRAGACISFPSLLTTYTE